MKSWLSRRWAAVGVVGLAVLLQAPSLTTGFVADDHLQQLAVRGDASVWSAPRSKLDLFTFARDPQANRALMDAGVFPWTTDLQLRLAFFRPLASLTHLLDEAVAPRSAGFAHATNLLWFALGLGALLRVYRRLMPEPWLAVLALLLYAVDDARGPTVGWVANRNALCALALALPALELHDRWRKGSRLAGVAAPLLLGVSLLAGESALAIVAYLVAYAWCLEPGPLKRRAASLLPTVAVVAAWSALYRALGYGVSGSGVYFDPARELAAFAAAVPLRLPPLLISQYAFPWSDFDALYALISPALHLGVIAGAAAGLAVLTWAAWPVLRGRPEARFFALGALGAAIPICATFPADRLLTFTGVGAMGVVALLLADSPGSLASPVRRPLALNQPKRWLVRGLIALHLVLAPPLAALRSRSMDTAEQPLALADHTLPASADLATRTVVLLNPPIDPMAGYLLPGRANRGIPRPARLRWLASGVGELEVTRVDLQTLRCRPRDGFLANPTEHMVRSRPFSPGETIELAGMTVVIAALRPDGRAGDATFHFDVPLEDPSLLWFSWSDHGFAPWTAPPVGQTITIEARDFFAAVTGAAAPSAAPSSR